MSHDLTVSTLTSDDIKRVLKTIAKKGDKRKEKIVAILALDPDNLQYFPLKDMLKDYSDY